MYLLKKVELMLWTDFLTGLCLIQGGYFLMTGVWPLVSMATFQAVTGPKVEHWLVKTVGALVAIIAIAMISAGLRHHFSQEMMILAVGSALGLGSIDVIYVSLGRISKVYLIDAALQALFLIGWGIVLIRN